MVRSNKTMAAVKKIGVYAASVVVALLVVDYTFIKLTGQTPAQALTVVLYSNIRSSSRLDGCDPTYPCIDNRSQYTRQSSMSSYRAFGNGTWSVDMQFADGTPVAWTSFGSTAQVSQAGPSSGIGFGIGPASLTKNYHDYIRFVMTGDVTIQNYSGTRQFWWLPAVASIAFPLPLNQGGTNSIYGFPYNVFGFGAKADGSSDDTSAINAAFSFMCAAPNYNGYGSKGFVFPPPSVANGYYKITSTISVPCSNITVSGSGSLAPILYSGTGALFSVDGKQNVTFTNLFMAGNGGATQVGIYIHNTNSTKVTNSFIGEFGAKPDTNTISACSATNPIICTTPIAPPSGDVYLGGFTGAGTWEYFNTRLTVTKVSGTTFSIPIDGTSLPAITGRPAWGGIPNGTGHAIQIVGDNLTLEIGYVTIEVWDDGFNNNGTTDVLNFHDNTCGVSTGNSSGPCIVSTNSSGSGQNRYVHNNIVTPGGVGTFGPIGGLLDYEHNQFEALATNPPLLNENSAAVVFLSNGKVYAVDNNVGLHSTGRYCYKVTDFSFGVFQSNSCFDSITNQWENSGAPPSVVFDNNTNLNSGTPQTYVNPYSAGITTRSYYNGWECMGTVYCQAPFHVNSPYSPVNFSTTLGAAITTTSQTTVTLYSWQAAQAYNYGFQLIDPNGCVEQVTIGGTSGGSISWPSGPPCTVGTTTSDNSVTWKRQGEAPIFKYGPPLYIGNEQLPVTSVSFPTVTVARGANGTTAATAINGATVTLGPYGGLLLTSTQSSASGASINAGVGYNTEVGGPYSWIGSTAPGSPHYIQTPIPLFVNASSMGTLPLPYGSTCTVAMTGQTRVFNNSTANTWGSTIAGGGSYTVIGWCNGSNWTVFGK